MFIKKLKIQYQYVDSSKCNKQAIKQQQTNNNNDRNNHQHNRCRIQLQHL